MHIVPSLSHKDNYFVPNSMLKACKNSLAFCQYLISCTTYVVHPLDVNCIYRGRKLFEDVEKAKLSR